MKDIKTNTNNKQDQTVKKILDDRKHLAGVIEVLDLEVGRASKDRKHTKKYLNRKSLSPFEIIVYKN